MLMLQELFGDRCVHLFNEVAATLQGEDYAKLKMQALKIKKIKIQEQPSEDETELSHEKNFENRLAKKAF